MLYNPNHCSMVTNCSVTELTIISKRRATQVRHKVQRSARMACESLGRAFTARAIWEDDHQGTRGPPATARARHEVVACLLMFQTNKNPTTLRRFTLTDISPFRPWAMTIWTVRCSTTTPVPNPIQTFSVSQLYWLIVCNSYGVKI